MPYFEILSDIYSDYGITKYPDLPVGLRFKSGKPLPEDLIPLPIKFHVNHSRGANPEHLLGVSIPVVSHLFVECLQKAGVDNFQTFSALLINPDTGQEWNTHVALNILGLLDVVDLASSEYTQVMGGGSGEGEMPPLLGFQKIVIDSKRAKRYDLFRLLQEPGRIIVNDKVLNLLRDSAPEEGWGISIDPLEHN